MNSNDSHCKIIYHSNNTFFESKFDGILENLMINTVISVTIVLTFLVLKALAWRRRKSKLLFFQQRWITLLYRDVFDLLPEYFLKRMRSTPRPLDMDMSFFQMIWYCFFKMTNEEIVEKCGADALEYLKFMHCSLEYNFINTLCTILFILPTNFLGSMQIHRSLFVRTTMGNIDFIKSNNYLWIHVCVALLLTLFCLLKIRSISASLAVYQGSAWSEKSVTVSEKRNETISVDVIETYFRTVLPTAEIEDIKLVFNYKRLLKFHYQLRYLEESLIICEHILSKESRRVYVKRHCWCCHFHRCCPCKTKVEDGIEYYNNEIYKVKVRLAKELGRLSSKILPFAFVTFRRDYFAVQARNVKKESSENENGKYYKSLKIHKAPDPANIIWECLTKRRSNISIKTLIVNTAVLLVAVFLTTPTIIISSSAFENVSDLLRNQGFFIFRFLPTLVVWLLSIAITGLVTYSSSFLDFETKSAYNRSIMLKTVSFLIFSVVLLPSLGLTSISAFVIWSITQGDREYQWGCIFLPDNGSFFVSYVMTSAFTGVLIQLLGLPQVFLCTIRVWKSKSEAEKVPIRRANIWDYSYGIQYSYALLIFTLVLFYSLMCPMIAPFGLAYFSFKLLVDRYNICFSCSPSRTSYRVHSLALQFMMFALVMKDVGLFFVIYVRGGFSPVTYASQALAWFTLLVCIISMNPFQLRFLPRSLLMPHQVNLKTFRDYFEDAEEAHSSVKQQVYQPLALRRYIHLVSPIDEYENPILPGDDKGIDKESLSLEEVTSLSSDPNPFEAFLKKADIYSSEIFQ